MPQIALAVPILPGKLGAYKDHMAKMNGPEFASFMKDYGLDKVTVWHQRNPDGSDLALVLHDGPNPQKWFAEAMTADNPIAEQWRAMAAEMHGMTKGAPMPEISPLGEVGS